MIKEVHYQGITAVPDDYQAPDGTLTAALNLVPEDGQLKPLPQPNVLFQLSSTDIALFIHKTSTFTHYICSSSNGLSLCYYTADGTRTSIHTFSSSSILKVSAVGNTLCVLCDDGLHYILWKSLTAAYSYLGQQPPYVSLRFSPSQIYPAKYDNDTTVNRKYARQITVLDASAITDTINGDGSTISFHPLAHSTITENTWALINRANALVAKAGHFYAPFFVRYCYRLYDGSMIMHSAPVFVPITMPVNYLVEAINYAFDSSTNSVHTYNHDYKQCTTYGNTPLDRFTLVYRPVNVALRYKCTDSDLADLKSNWSDIVKSIDVFVSLPITRENDGEYIQSASRVSFASCLANENGDDSDEAEYLSNTFSLTYRDTQNNNDESSRHGNFALDIPMLSDTEYLKKIKNTASFFKVCSLAIGNDEVSQGHWVNLPIEGSTLQALATQEAMTDDYKTHNLLLPAYDTDGQCISTLYPFNSRLNVAGLREKLYPGFKLKNLKTSGYVNSSQDTAINIRGIYIFLDTEEGEKMVHRLYDGTTTSIYQLVSVPLFYPDNRAKKMIIQYQEYSTTSPNPNPVLYAVLPMEPCPLLNGAFTSGLIPHSFSASFTDTTSVSPIPDTIPDALSIVSVPNKLYSSEVNNPFFFPVTGINTIGTGNILGIATVTEPLSQGQFGYADLYIFCSDGLWVAEISHVGKVSAVKPLNRDVCTNPSSITQLGNSVLYATSRGIMQLLGRSTTCITDPIATQTPFDALTKLPMLSTLNSSLSSPAPFLSFLEGCNLVYDYLHQRIILFNTPDIERTIDHYEQQGGGIVGYDDNDLPIYGATKYVAIYSYTYTPRYPYAYVYSLRSKQWGMMYSNLASSLNSYPDSLVMDCDHNLVSFGQPSFVSKVQSLLITRPLKLDAPDTLKTIRTLIQRGMFQRGDVQTVLYGSRDLIHWHLIATSSTEAIRSLRGTPYKYFRIAATASLADGQSLSGVSLEVQPRPTSILL